MNLRIEDRSRVTVHGVYRHGQGPERPAIVIDLSPKGCRMLERFHRLPAGSEIMLSVGHITPFPAKVCWNEGDFFGIEFVRPLHRVVLDHLYSAKMADFRRPLHALA